MSSKKIIIEFWFSVVEGRRPTCGPTKYLNSSSPTQHFACLICWVGFSQKSDLVSPLTILHVLINVDQCETCAWDWKGSVAPNQIPHSDPLLVFKWLNCVCLIGFEWLLEQKSVFFHCFNLVTKWGQIPDTYLDFSVSQIREFKCSNSSGNVNSWHSNYGTTWIADKCMSVLHVCYLNYCLLLKWHLFTRSWTKWPFCSWTFDGQITFNHSYSRQVCN